MSNNAVNYLKKLIDNRWLSMDFNKNYILECQKAIIGFISEIRIIESIVGDEISLANASEISILKDEYETLRVSIGIKEDCIRVCQESINADSLEIARLKNLIRKLKGH
jgi:hypothetical protein